MKIKNRFNLLTILTLLLFAFMVSGCASLDDARKLNNEGKKEEALDKAAEFLSSDDPKERIEAINLIGKIGGNRAGGLIVPRLQDEDRKVQIAAIKNVGILKHVPASEELVSMSLNATGETLEELGKAIRNIGDPAINLLIDKYASSVTNANDKEVYKKLIIFVGPAVTTKISSLLKGKSYFENKSTFDILVALRNPNVAKKLVPELANDEIAHMVIEALTKLGSLAVDAVIDDLTEKQQKGNPVVIERLVKTLGNLKAQRGVHILEKLTKHNSERVRAAATFSLSQIRGF